MPMSVIQWTKASLRKTLDADQRTRLIKFQSLRFRGLQHFVYRWLIGSNLKAHGLRLPQ